MPHVTVYPGTEHKPVYQVGGKSFVFFQNQRPDAFDPVTGERYDDVIVFWVPNEGDKLAMVICRSCCGRAGSARSATTSSPKSCRWPGCRAAASRRAAWLNEHLPD
jgi:hypothetical protein